MKKLNYLCNNSININLCLVEDSTKLSYSQKYNRDYIRTGTLRSTWSEMFIEVRMRGLSFCNVKNNQCFKDIMKSKRLKNKIFRLVFGTFAHKDKDFKMKIANEIILKIENIVS